MLVFSKTLLEKASNTSFSWNTSPALMDSTMAGVPPSSLSSISSMYLCVSWVTWKWNNECFKYLPRLSNTLNYQQLENSQLVLPLKDKWKMQQQFVFFKTKQSCSNRNNTTFSCFKGKLFYRNNATFYYFCLKFIGYLSVIWVFSNILSYVEVIHSKKYSI